MDLETPNLKIPRVTKFSKKWLTIAHSWYSLDRNPSRFAPRARTPVSQILIIPHPAIVNHISWYFDYNDPVYYVRYPFMPLCYVNPTAFIG